MTDRDWIDKLDLTAIRVWWCPRHGQIDSPVCDECHMSDWRDSGPAESVTVQEILDRKLADYPNVLAERDAFAKAVMAVSVELIDAGYPAGDSTVMLANVRAVLTELADMQARLDAEGGFLCEAHDNDGVFHEYGVCLPCWNKAASELADAREQIAVLEKVVDAYRLDGLIAGDEMYDALVQKGKDGA